MRGAHLTFLAALICGWLPPAGRAEESPSPPRWQPWVELGARAGDGRAMAEAEWFVPLSQGPEDIVFANLRTALMNEGALEGNFGIGWRTVLDEARWIVGLNGFFDARRSEENHRYAQVGAGFEVFHGPWSLTGNGYVPVGRDRNPLPGRAQSVLTPGGLFVRPAYEVAYHGFDLEAGHRFALYDDAAGDVALALYGGGYWFDAEDVRSFWGPRARAELVYHDAARWWPGSRWALTGEIQTDRERGSAWLVGAKFRIPLQASPALARTTDLDRLMMGSVRRDLDVIVQGQVLERYDPAEIAGLGSVAGRRIVRITAAMDFMAIINDPANDGALFIADGGAGAFDTGAVSLALRPGQALIGSAAPLSARGQQSGQVATNVLNGIAPARFQAHAGVHAIRVASQTAVVGIEAHAVGAGVSTGAIVGDNADDVLIMNNRLTAAGPFGRGILMRAGSDNATIRNNQIEATGAEGYAVNVYHSMNARIEGNVLRTTGASAMGVFLLNTQNANVRNNTVATTAMSGIGIGSFNSVGDRIEGNQVTTAGQWAYGLYAANTQAVEFVGNRVATTGLGSVALYLEGGSFGMNRNSLVAGNDLAASGDQTPVALAYLARDYVFRDNRITYDGDLGAGLMLEESFNGRVLANRIRVEGVDSAGIYLLNTVGGLGNEFRDNVILSAGQDGINQMGRAFFMQGAVGHIHGGGNQWTGEGGGLCRAVAGATRTGAVTFNAGVCN